MRYPLDPIIASVTEEPFAGACIAGDLLERSNLTVDRAPAGACIAGDHLERSSLTVDRAPVGACIAGDSDQDFNRDSCFARLALCIP
jgi:hypothetical protein